MCYKSPFCFVLGDGSTSVNRSGKGVIGTPSSAIVKQVERNLFRLPDKRTIFMFDNFLPMLMRVVAKCAKCFL